MFDFWNLERLERKFKQCLMDGFSIFKHIQILELGTLERKFK